MSAGPKKQRAMRRSELLMAKKIKEGACPTYLDFLVIGKSGLKHRFFLILCFFLIKEKER